MLNVAEIFTQFVVLNVLFHDKINEIVQRTIEHGFTKHFQEKTERILNLANIRRTSLQQNQYNFIGFYDLEFYFTIYLCGILMSIVIFLIELIFNSAKKSIDLHFIKFYRTRKSKVVRTKCLKNVDTYGRDP